MSHRLLVITGVLVIALFSLPVDAQTAPAKAADDSLAATRKKAVDLLLSVASQVDSLRSAENRARIGSNLASSLWPYDEKRARELLSSVQTDINSGLSDTDPNYESRIHTQTVFLRLRRDTVERMAKHDPELAASFLRATRPPAEAQLASESGDSEKELEAHLALMIVGNAPELALKLGRQVLARNFSEELLPLLLKIQRKDNSAAQSFYKEIVDKLKTSNLNEDAQAIELAMELARSFPPPLADEHTYQDLIGILLASALAEGCANADKENAAMLCYQLGSVYAQMEKYYGLRAVPLKIWFDPNVSYGGPPNAAWRELTEATESGTIEDLLALAERYPGLQESVYWAAVRKAEISGDVARARQLAADAPNRQLGARLLAQIEQDQQGGSLNEEKLAVIRQRITGFNNDRQRVQFLFGVAAEIGRRDQKQALEFLDQAALIIEGIKPGKEQLEAQLALAIMYCGFRSNRGFAVMEALIPKLNELVAAAATLDGFGYTYLREGEWNMSGETGLGRLLNTLSQNAGVFARLDLDRSVALTRQFERIEIRLMGQLKLAQSILDKQPVASLSHLNSRPIIDY